MKKWSPLLRALVGNSFCENQLTLLLADIHDVTDMGSTVLHFAALRRDPRFVVFLLQQEGVQVDTINVYGETALHWAVKADREQVILFLLAKGARADFLDSQGASPIDWATEEGHHHLLPLLRRDRPCASPALLHSCSDLLGQR